MTAAKTTATKFDLYQYVTDKIIAALEDGVVPWQKSWTTDDDTPSGDWPRNANTNRGYNGINVVLLWLASMENGFTDPRWLTYRQAKLAGGNVRKGERGFKITFWKTYKKKNEAGEEETRFVLRGFTVFNVEQCEGLTLCELEPVTEFEEVASKSLSKRIVAHAGVLVRHGGSRCVYYPSGDFIAMPKPENFPSQQHYDRALLHELTHWTGHESRLNRVFGQGKAAYAKEELIADMGSAFLCYQLGIPLSEMDHPSYLQSWIDVLKTDKRAIIKAAGAARRACEYLLAPLQSTEE